MTDPASLAQRSDSPSDLLATVRVAEKRDIPRASVPRRERDVGRLVQRVPRREQLGFVDDQTPPGDQAAGEYRLAVQAASVHPNSR